MVKDSALGEANNRWHWPTTRGPTAAAVRWRQRRRSIMIVVVASRVVSCVVVCVWLCVPFIYSLSLSLRTIGPQNWRSAVGVLPFQLNRAALMA